jgi:LmbE family N-acetylglucosaminyl deacetylase
MRIVVVAPHPDDEVLGCGGTIAKLAREGHDVFVVVATKAGPPLYTEAFLAQGRKELAAAHKVLGVKESFFCDLPAAALDVTPHGQVNKELSRLITELEPDTLFVPFFGDIHLDHQHIFLSALVAARPNQAAYPRKILAYETLSETNWNAPYLTPGFHPNVFIDITETLAVKLKAFACYQSQVKEFPHERSLTALEALAKLRGATVFCAAAEAFVLIREVIK